MGTKMPKQVTFNADNCRFFVAVLDSYGLGIELRDALKSLGMGMNYLEGRNVVKVIEIGVLGKHAIASFLSDSEEGTDTREAFIQCLQQLAGKTITIETEGEEQ